MLFHLFVTSASEGGGGYVLTHAYLFGCLLAQHLSYGWISMKFVGKVCHGLWKKWLNCGDDPNAKPGMFELLLLLLLKCQQNGG